MNRRNAVQIRPNDDQCDNADLMLLLNSMTDYANIVCGEVPELGKDDVFFIKPSRIKKELFKHEGCFEWISGSVRLWHNGEPVTRQNYRTVISGEDEPVKYEYINWYRMSVEAPEPKEEV